MLTNSWLKNVKARSERAPARADRRRSTYRPALDELEGRCLLSTFSVLNTNDSGAGSLRQAIIGANAASGADVIAFSMPGTGLHTITPLTALPMITDSVTVDGYTQPGSSPNTLAAGSNAALRVELRGGASFSPVLRIGSNSSIVRGLVINHVVSTALEISGTNNRVEGVFIGTDVTGSTSQLFDDSSSGIAISGNSNTVGGTAAAARNLISAGSLGDGISLNGGGTGGAMPTGNVIQGNLIGVNAAGTAGLGTFTGIVLGAGSGNLVGGTDPAAGNVIAFSRMSGVYINSDGNTVAGNVIYSNGGAGVSVAFGTSNAILSNSISSNTALGIDLGGTGANANDLGDGDTGANKLQNFPVLTTVESTAAATTVGGTLNSTANRTFRLEFFANAVRDPSTFGEGERFLGATTVTTDGSGNVSFSVTFPTAVPAGQFVSATATDPDGNTSEFGQDRTVVAGNRAPVASPDAYSVNEDATLNVAAPGVLANDSDPDGNPLSAVYVSGPTNGTLTLNANGSFTYTPAANFFGPASFAYKAGDGTSFSTTVTVSLTVNAVNDAPSFTKGADLTVAEDAGAQTVPGWATGVSPIEAGQTVQFLVSNNNPALFWLQPGIAADGNLSFAPAPDAHGTATVSVLLKDNGGTANGGQDTSAAQTFTITVTPGNDAPVAVGDERTTDEDVPVTVAVLVNDFDADDAPHAGAPFFAFNSQTVTSDASGPLLISSGGTNFFAFRNLDSGSGSATAIGGFTSLAGLPPGDLTFTLGDLELVDFIGTTTTATEVYAEGDGNVVPFMIFRGGTFAGTGSDLVLTIVTDRDPSSATFGLARGFAQVTLTGVAGDPFFDEVLALTGGTGRLRATLGSFVPTTFADPETFVSTGAFVLNRLIVSSVTNGANGTASIAPDGAAVTYTPNADFHGTDSFTYTIRDPDGSTATATVSMTVRSRNDAPQASGDSYLLNEDHVLAVAAPGVLANDSDADGDPLSFGGLTTPPQHGTVVFQADGSFTYTPAQDFVGTDSFTYRANDASLTPSNVATVSLTVLPVNDAPGFTPGPDLLVYEDSGLATIPGWATDIIAGPANESTQALSFQVSAANPALFAVQPALAPDGTLTFAPAADANGSTSMTVTLQDDGGTDNNGTDTSAPRTFSLLIAAVNDAPTANNLSVAGAEDSPLPGQVGGGDVDGDPLSFALATGPQHGTVNLSADGSFLYEPHADFNGTDTFTFTSADAELSSPPATVTLTITPVNDPSVAVGDDYTTHVNAPLEVPAAGSVVLNDFDVDGDAVQFAGLSANPTHGSISFQADGTFRYTPQAGFVGADTFSYLVSDGQSVSAPGVVTIHVLNDPPTANDDSFSVPQDSGTTSLDVLANDTSAPDAGETLTITSVGVGSAGGTITSAGGTSIDYRPAPHFTGTETFTYTVNDGTPGSDATATVAVIVDAAIRSSRLQGLVWEDFNDDGAVDFGEKAIEDVAVRLTGRDDLGAAVDRVLATDAQGIFEFLGLRPSDPDGYALMETQPAGYVDGKEVLGTVNGSPSGTASDNVFAGIALSAAGSDGVNYNFGERPAAGSAVQQGQTATIGFWQNKNGQRLIQALNGGPSSTQLGNWLAQTLPSLYGPSAGGHNLVGKTNSQVATLFVSLFKQTTSVYGPPKLDAQVLATAFAVYVTNESLAGQTATAYGFHVTAGGLGTATFDVGDANRAAFGLSPTDGTVLTVLDVLRATDTLSRDGVLYDEDGSGVISSFEKELRQMANSVFTAINEQGDI